MSITCLAVVFEFASSHRLFLPELSNDENEALFGKCSNPNGHGHNYVLDVRISGEVNPRTGMLIDAGRVKSLVQSTIIDDIDHRDLNRDVTWLLNKVPTTEVVANAIFERLTDALRGEPLPVKLDSITLHETRRISVTVSRRNS